MDETFAVSTSPFSTASNTFVSDTLREGNNSKVADGVPGIVDVDVLGVRLHRWMAGEWVDREKGGGWMRGVLPGRQRGSLRARSRVVSVRVCVPPLCVGERAWDRASERSRGGSCHGNRGCRLVPQDLSCPRTPQTSLLSLANVLAPFPRILQSPALLLFHSCNRDK